MTTYEVPATGPEGEPPERVKVYASAHSSARRSGSSSCTRRYRGYFHRFLKRRAAVGREEFYKPIHPCLIWLAFIPSFLFSLYVICTLAAWGTCPEADSSRGLTCISPVFPVFNNDWPTTRSRNCACGTIMFEENVNHCNTSENVARSKVTAPYRTPTLCTCTHNLSAPHTHALSHTRAVSS